jgi:hypothetical protein
MGYRVCIREESGIGEARLERGKVGLHRPH